MKSKGKCKRYNFGEIEYVMSDEVDAIEQENKELRTRVASLEKELGSQLGNKNTGK